MGRTFTLCCSLAMFAFACSSNPTPTPVQPTPPATAPDAAPSGPPVVEKSLDQVGLSEAALDRSADPCDDFYQFACGGWLANTEIPADRTSWSRGFSEIHDRNQDTLHTILEAAAAGGKDPDPGTKKLGDFYGSCMDEAAIEKAGLSAIEPWLKQARKVRNKKQIAALVTDLQAHGVGVLFGFFVNQDMKDPTKMVAQVWQGGLGLPDRDYYLKDDDKTKAIRTAYTEHVAKMLQLAGAKPAAAKRGAANVLAFETELAKASKPRVEMRDPKGLDNRLDLAGVEKAAPNFDWKSFFEGMGKPGWTAINVLTPKFLDQINTMLTKTKPAEWRSYLEWHILDSEAGRLPKAFVNENFAMTKQLTGQEKLRDRWKRCVAATDNALPDLLGPAFVKAKFSGDAKAAALNMVHAISGAFGQSLLSEAWMDAATRKLAEQKLSMMAYLIGYPDKWKTYDFTVSRDNYAANAIAADHFQVAYDMSKLGKPVDRTEWSMSAPTVNAYYNPSMNHMVFPAGILQPPFYDPKASAAVNLGGMGMIVGHELTHGFDDQGSQFDGNGALKNWWTPAVAKSFDSKKQCVIDQYDAYEPLPDVHLNGKLTLGENIADMGGVKMAFEAYRAMRKDAKEKVLAGGFTEDQQYFLAVGQAWCTKIRPQMQRMYINVNPHSPARFRVDGSLSNLPAFSEAFQCKKGTKMNRENMCTVW